MFSSKSYCIKWLMSNNSSCGTYEKICIQKRIMLINWSFTDRKTEESLCMITKCSVPAAHVNIDAGAAAVLNRAIVSYREVFATAAPVGIYNRHIGVGHAIHRSARDRVRFTAVFPSIDFRKRIVNNNRTNNNNKKKKSSRNIIRHRPILLVVIKNIITRVCVCVYGFRFVFSIFFFIPNTADNDVPGILSNRASWSLLQQ